MIGLVFSVLASQGRRIARLPVPPGVLAAMAVLLLTLVAVRASAAWWELYGEDWPEEWSSRLVALSLIAAVTAQPVFALLVAVGLRTEK